MDPLSKKQPKGQKAKHEKQKVTASCQPKYGRTKSLAPVRAEKQKAEKTVEVVPAPQEEKIEESTRKTTGNKSNSAKRRRTSGQNRVVLAGMITSVLVAAAGAGIWMLSCSRGPEIWEIANVGTMPEVSREHLLKNDAELKVSYLALGVTDTQPAIAESIQIPSTVNAEIFSRLIENQLTQSDKLAMAIMSLRNEFVETDEGEFSQAIDASRVALRHYALFGQEAVLEAASEICPYYYYVEAKEMFYLSNDCGKEKPAVDLLYKNIYEVTESLVVVHVKVGSLESRAKNAGVANDYFQSDKKELILGIDYDADYRITAEDAEYFTGYRIVFERTADDELFFSFVERE